MVDYTISPSTQFNLRTFGLWATRDALGNLDRINVADAVRINRTLIEGSFKNVGTEGRLLHRYAGKHTLLVGIRLYKGTTTARQGDAGSGSDADFSFLHPQHLEGSDFRFPNYNYSAFIENIFALSPKISLTPGVRWEYIRTISSGYYRQRVLNYAGNVVSDTAIADNRAKTRSFIIAGVGVSYKPSENKELYANVSQNYRAINFTDMRVANPNYRIDPNLKDEMGFTGDIGFRGGESGFFTYDVSAFWVEYKGRIGQILQTDTTLGQDYRLRKNISDARNLGLELFGEINILKAINKSSKNQALTLFTNFAYVDARYIHTQEAIVRGKKVELVPPITLRTGCTYKRGPFSTSIQYSYVARQFSDATNAVRTSTAIEGEIPAYQVWDLSVKYSWRRLMVEASCNNLLNAHYFTRRAESYPGPGIIPADGRGFYATIGIKI
jgi:Fe(3+) dicitrate transport protein